MYIIRTFYPDSNPEVSSVDGGLRSDRSTTVSWATLRGSANYVFSESEQIFCRIYRSSASATGWRDAWRSIVSFDTSKLGTEAEVVSGIISLYVSSKVDNYSSSIVVTSGTLTSRTSLATEDWLKVGLIEYASTEFSSRKTVASISTPSWVDFELNASGVAYINRTGRTGSSTFAFLISHDFDNNQPSSPTTGDEYIVIYNADAAQYVPKLTLTYKGPNHLRQKEIILNTTVSGANVPTDQSDFPICVHINSSSWPDESERTTFFNAETTGKRVNFFTADKVTSIPFEVELFSPVSGEAIYWCRVPVVSGNTNTSIFMGFGNDAYHVNQDDAKATWGNGYFDVLHLNGNVLDSLNNTVSDTATTNVSGVIAFGRNFNGSSSVLSLTDNARYQTQALTVEMWTYRKPTYDEIDMLAAYKRSGYSTYGWAWYENGPLDFTPTTSGVASASGYYSAQYPNLAIDNDTGTYWAVQNNNQPTWWKYDLGEGVTKVIRAFRVYNYNNYGMNAFSIQGSNDDISYNVIYNGNAANTAAWQQFEFSNSNAYRYYRINITSFYHTTYCRIYEFGFFQNEDAYLQFTGYSSGGAANYSLSWKATPLNEWHYTAVVCSGNALPCFGAVNDETSPGTSQVTHVWYTVGSNSMLLGRYTTVDTTYWYNGYMDEYRYSTIARTKDWLRLSYISTKKNSNYVGDGWITWNTSFLTGAAELKEPLLLTEGTVQFWTKRRDISNKTERLIEQANWRLHARTKVMPDQYKQWYMKLTETNPRHVHLVRRATDNVIDYVSPKEAEPIHVSYPHFPFSGYPYYKAINVNTTSTGANTTTTVSGFPICVHINSTSWPVDKDHLFTSYNPLGDRIEFFANDKETVLPYEIEYYSNSAKEAIYWVQVPTISGQAINTIYMAYGIDSGHSRDSKGAVWNNGYKRVFHMDGVVDQYDSANGFTAVRAENGTTGVTSRQGPYIGFGTRYAQLFVPAGTNQIYQEYFQDGYVTASAWSISLWCYNSSSLPTIEYAVGFNTTAFGGFYTYYSTGTKWGIVDAGGTARNANTTPVVSTRYFMSATNAATAASGIFHFYLNGVSDSSDIAGATTNLTSVRLGFRGDNNWGMKGYLDEIRISNVARSADWIKLEYYSMDSVTDDIGYTGDRWITWGKEQSDTFYKFLHFKDITFDTTSSGANVLSNQTDFPITLVINESTWPSSEDRNALFSAYNVSGARIIFFDTDYKSTLDYEVEQFNATSGIAIYWVKIPTVYGNAVTTIKMCYGNDVYGFNQESVADVWSNNYYQVLHLGGNTAPAIDSRGNNSGTNYGTVPSGGVIGDSRYFDNTDDYIQFSDTSTNRTTVLTLESLVYRNPTYCDSDLIFAHKRSGATTYGYAFYIYGPPDYTYPGITCSGSSEYSAQYDHLAIDDNTGTYWSTVSSPTMPAWWAVDFGAGNEKTITCCRILNYASYGINGFSFQGSNDSNEWTTLYTGSAANTAAWQQFTFTNTTSYRWYRFWITSKYGSYLRVYEFQLSGESNDVVYWVGYTSGANAYVASGTLLSLPNTWEYVAAVSSGVGAQSFVMINDVPCAGVVAGTQTFYSTVGNHTVYLGRYTNVAGSEYYWGGFIDEFRFSTVARSIDWLKLSYYSLMNADTWPKYSLTSAVYIRNAIENISEFAFFALIPKKLITNKTEKITETRNYLLTAHAKRVPETERITESIVYIRTAVKDEKERIVENVVVHGPENIQVINEKVRIPEKTIRSIIKHVNEYVSIKEPRPHVEEHLAKWVYKKTIPIYAAVGAGTEYQIPIIVNYTGETASSGIVSCQSYCRTDFGDVRFVTSSGEVLHYWISNKVDSSYAQCWVRITDNLNSNTSIYCCFGNPSAASRSNFDDTFIFGDPWSSSSLDTFRWITVSGAPTYTVDTTNHYLSITSMNSWSWNVGAGFIAKQIAVPSGWAIEDAWQDLSNPSRDAGVRIYLYSTTNTLGQIMLKLTPSASGYAYYGTSFIAPYDGHATPTNQTYMWAGVAGNVDYDSGNLSSQTVDKRFLQRRYDGSIRITEGGTSRVNEVNLHTPDRFHIEISKYQTFEYSDTRLYGFIFRKYTYPEPLVGIASQLQVYKQVVNETERVSASPSLHPTLMDLTYPNSKRIGVDTTTLGLSADQANFPICIHINNYSFISEFERGKLFGSYNISGARIHFFDNTQQIVLPYEVEYYSSTNQEAIYWVRITNIVGSGITNIYLAYGVDTFGSDQSNKNAVWSNNYAMVHHLGDNAWTTVALDSTSNANNGTNSGTTDREGIIRRGRDFDGTNDKITVTDKDSLDISNNLSITFWITFDSYHSNYARHPFSKWGGSTTAANYVFYYFGSGPPVNTIGWYGTGGAVWKAISSQYAIASVPSTYHIGFTYNSTTGGQLYINGVAEGTRAGSGALSTNTYQIDWGQTPGNNYFDGMFDELRMSSVVERSADWIKLEYYSTKKTNYNGDTIIKFANPKFVGVNEAARVIENWWLDPSLLELNYDYYKPIYIDTTASGASVFTNQYDFPIIASINQNNWPEGDWNNFLAGNVSGARVQFFAANNWNHPLSYEVVVHSGSYVAGYWTNYDLSKYPGTVTTQSVNPEDDDDWVNPDYVKLADDQLASVTAASYDKNDITYRLKCTNFGFSIPSGAQILDIIPVIWKRCDAGEAYDYRVQLYGPDGNFKGNSHPDSQPWPATATAMYYYTYDLWNTTWSASDINDTDFGICLSVKANAQNTDIFSDFIYIHVDWRVWTPEIPAQYNYTYYVKVPTISGNAITTIYIGYGNDPFGHDVQNIKDTWSNNYYQVLHLEEKLLPPFYDSVGNNNGTDLISDTGAVYNVSIIMYGSNVHRLGEKFTGITIYRVNSVRLYLSRQNNPTGTVYVTLRRVSDDYQLGILGSIDVGLISGPSSLYTFSNPVDNLTGAEIYLLVEFDGWGTFVQGDPANSHYIAVGICDIDYTYSTDIRRGVRVYKFSSGGTYYSSSTDDLSWNSLQMYATAFNNITYIDGGRTFDGDVGAAQGYSKISFTDTSVYDTQILTIEAWKRNHATGFINCAIFGHTNASAQYGYYMWETPATSGVYAEGLHFRAVDAAGASLYETSLSGVYQSNTWQYVAAVCSGVGKPAFVAVNDTYGSGVAQVTHVFTTTQYPMFGTLSNNYPNRFDGDMTEYRFSTVARTKDWLRLSYYSAKKTDWNGDDIISFGNEEHFTHYLVKVKNESERINENIRLWRKATREWVNETERLIDTPRRVLKLVRVINEKANIYDRYSKPIKKVINETERITTTAYLKIPNFRVPEPPEIERITEQTVVAKCFLPLVNKKENIKEAIHLYRHATKEWSYNIENISENVIKIKKRVVPVVQYEERVKKPIINAIVTKLAGKPSIDTIGTDYVVQVISCEIDYSFDQTSASCILTIVPPIDINGNYVDFEPMDRVKVKQGWNTTSNLMITFLGFVDTVSKEGFPKTMTLNCRDILKLAYNNFYTSSNRKYYYFEEDVVDGVTYPATPEEQRYAHSVVQQLLEESGISSYRLFIDPAIVTASGGDQHTIILGNHVDDPFDVISMSALEAVQSIGSLIGYVLWAVPDGAVMFKEWRPIAGEVPKVSYYRASGFSDSVTGHFLNIEATVDDESIRNFVSIKGYNDPISGQVMSMVAGPSNYIPNPPEYRVCEIQSNVIDTQGVAEAIATRVYTDLNRLRYSAKVTIEGDPRIRIGDTIGIYDSGVTETTYFLTGISSSHDARGYFMNLTLDNGVGEGAPPISNRAPVALFTASLDQETLDGKGEVVILCDGSMSYDPDGPYSELTFIWSCAGRPTVSGLGLDKYSITCPTPSGTAITLVVADQGNPPLTGYKTKHLSFGQWQVPALTVWIAKPDSIYYSGDNTTWNVNSGGGSTGKVLDHNFIITSGWGSWLNGPEGCFYAVGRYWVCYSYFDAPGLCYASSADRENWIFSNDLMSEFWIGDYITSWKTINFHLDEYNDKTVYLAFGGHTWNNNCDVIWCRKGTLNSNGTITWDLSCGYENNGWQVVWVFPCNIDAKIKMAMTVASTGLPSLAFSYWDVEQEYTSCIVVKEACSDGYFYGDSDCYAAWEKVDTDGWSAVRLCTHPDASLTVVYNDGFHLYARHRGKETCWGWWSIQQLDYSGPMPNWYTWDAVENGEKVYIVYQSTFWMLPQPLFYSIYETAEDDFSVTQISLFTGVNQTLYPRLSVDEFNVILTMFWYTWSYGYAIKIPLDEDEFDAWDHPLNWSDNRIVTVFETYEELYLLQAVQTPKRCPIGEIFQTRSTYVEENPPDYFGNMWFDYCRMSFVGEVTCIDADRYATVAICATKSSTNTFIYKSVNNNAWEELLTKEVAVFGYFTSVCIDLIYNFRDTGNLATIYAGTSLGHIFKTTDGGKKWTLIYIFSEYGVGKYITEIKVSELDSNKVAVATENIIGLSIDGGVDFTWHPMTGREIRFLYTIEPTTSGFLWYRYNSGGSWTSWTLWDMDSNIEIPLSSSVQLAPIFKNLNTTASRIVTLGAEVRKWMYEYPYTGLGSFIVSTWFNNGYSAPPLYEGAPIWCQFVVNEKADYLITFIARVDTVQNDMWEISYPTVRGV